MHNENLVVIEASQKRKNKKIRPYKKRGKKKML
jgi:hypothetical protein